MGGGSGNMGQRQQGQQGQQGGPGKGGMPGGAPTANPQTQAQYQQAMPQQPQGLGALQNAYSQFQNSAPPQPNPMFGQQPTPTARASQISNLLDAYMNAGQQMPMASQMQAPMPPQVPMPPPPVN